MQLYQDIAELLESVKDNISKLSELYESARTDESKENISRPLVKSCLEHLRSTLEYSAQDIWKSFNNKSAKIYFPYGKNEDIFNANVKRNLPGVKEKRKNIYHLIESLQPHKCGDNWLISICDFANINKHNKLGSQLRENSPNNTITIGGITMRGCVDMKFENCYHNGAPLGNGINKFTISNIEPLENIKQKINKNVPIFIEFDWVKFNLDNTSIDALQLIKKGHEEITKYIESLKNELSK